MKRLLYLAILSMMAMVISAPAALAQQGGLCAGAQAVTSFSGNTQTGSVVNETEPFDISTEEFQVAVDNTSGDPQGGGNTYVVVEDSNGTSVIARNFEDGEDGIITVPNIGNGPFNLDISGDLQAYDITVYECPNGAGPEQPEETTTTPETTAAPTTPETTEMTAEPTTPEPTGDQPPTTTPSGGSTPSGGTGAPGGGGMTELPDTGGPDLLLPVAGLLAGSGILLSLFVAVRRRA